MLPNTTNAPRKDVSRNIDTPQKPWVFFPPLHVETTRITFFLIRGQWQGKGLPFILKYLIRSINNSKEIHTIFPSSIISLTEVLIKLQSNSF